MKKSGMHKGMSKSATKAPSGKPRGSSVNSEAQRSSVAKNMKPSGTRTA